MDCFSMMDKKLPIIGANTLVSICGRDSVPAKIDTGADSSSIWVSHLRIDEDNILRFRLFGEGSPFYTGKDISRKDYKVALVRSSTGEEQIRYRTHFVTTIKGRKIKILFNLSNRSSNHFPVLIGRRSISGKFLVDVSKAEVPRPPSTTTKKYQAILQRNPHKFYKKYSKKGAEK